MGDVYTAGLRCMATPFRSQYVRDIMGWGKMMDERGFAACLLAHHESAGDDGLFDLLVESMSEDEDLYETYININGDADFRLEVEEGVEGDVCNISVSVYRVVYGEHVTSSVTSGIDYERRDGRYYYPDDRSHAMSIADVYSEVMGLIRRVGKAELV